MERQLPDRGDDIPLVHTNGHGAQIVGAPLFKFADDSDARTEIRRQLVYDRWVQGRSMASICRELGHTAETVRHDVYVIREFLKGDRKAERLEAADRSIAHLRLLQETCWEMIADELNFKMVPQFMNTVIRCEEQIGRIEGITSTTTKHEGELTMKHKMYDLRIDCQMPQQMRHP